MVKMAGRGGEQDADDFVLDETQPLGAAPPMPIPEQDRLRGGAAATSSAFSSFATAERNMSSRPGMRRRQRIDRGGDPRGIETFVGLRSGECRNAVHDYPDIGQR